MVVFFIKVLKNVSCEYDRWVVETQLCKLRDTGTSDTLIGRACAMFSIGNMVIVNYIYDMWLLILSSTSFMVGLYSF